MTSRFQMWEKPRRLDRQDSVFLHTAAGWPTIPLPARRALNPTWLKMAQNGSKWHATHLHPSPLPLTVFPRPVAHLFVLLRVLDLAPHSVVQRRKMTCDSLVLPSTCTCQVHGPQLSGIRLTRISVHYLRSLTCCTPHARGLRVQGVVRCPCPATPLYSTAAAAPRRALNPPRVTAALPAHLS